MRKLLTSSIVISLLSATSLATNANDYTVQIGAYQVLTNQAISKAEQHGEVYQSIGNDNLTRLHVGRFASKVDAVNKRDQLRRSGYNDAFITQISVATPHQESSSSSSYQQSETNYQSAKTSHGSYNSSSSSSSAHHSGVSKNHSSDTNLSGLSPDEKSKAAFLDGQLRIHSNGQFFTLRQYREQTRQNNSYSQ